MFSLRTIANFCVSLTNWPLYDFLSYSCFIPINMKKAILFFALCFCSFTLSAQHFFGPSIFVGAGKYIRVESKLGPDILYKPLFVSGLGFNYEYRITQNSRIVTGLNFHTKGEKLSVKWDDLTFPDNIDEFYGFVKPENEIPTSNEKIVSRNYYLAFQLPLMYQYRFRSGQNNSWLFGIGASANFVMSSYVSSNTNEGYRNETAIFRRSGNTLTPSALLNIGFSQALKKRRALVYSIVYDQQLGAYYPDHPLKTDWNFNLGFSVSYLFYRGK